MSLFNQLPDTTKPLAERMRPMTLTDFLGQNELVDKGKILYSLIEKDQIPSMIFWGPPGTGKTTLAKIIANKTQAKFIQFSAVVNGIKEVKDVIVEATQNKKLYGQKTILFIDEIHRFNKAQQDAFLPHIENGSIILIGATTENPSFSVNNALLSRCKVFVFNALETKDIEKILNEAIKKYYPKAKIDKEIIKFLANMANGDARVALNVLEIAVPSYKKITIDAIKETLQKTHLLYDKKGDEHYNIISALHKSMRGSDPDASLYWLVRMLEAGEDPLYIARRVVRFASEDIGLANSQALNQAVAAFQACKYIGMPECGVNLAQAVVYMAMSKKSVTLYKGYNKAREDVMNNPNEPVPIHLRNAPTKMMKELGFGKDYKYNPDYEGKVEQEYLPKKLKGKKYLEI
jgi:putative ATPase